VEFLNPAALYSLLLLPLLLIAYLIRRRPRAVVFSSLLLMREFAARVSGRRSGVPPIFFLHLIILSLLLLSLGEPSLTSQTMNVALVLDNSASMQAAEDGRTRFQAAVEEAGKFLRALPAGARVDVYLFAPRLARIGEAALAAAAALNLIYRQKPIDVGEAAVDHGAELSRLARDRGYEQLYFVTDHPATGQSRTVRVVTVGHRQNNLAVGSFQLNRAAFNSSQLDARVEVRSFSAREGTFRLNLKAAGKVVSTRAYTIAPGKSIAADFEALPSYPFYEAEIAADDGLALDNRRFAVPPPSGELKILAVSPRPEALVSLRAIPGVELQIVSPEAYGKGNFPPHALEIFHYATPAALPDSPALFILPPAENPLVRVAASSTRPIVTGWRDPHPLTRYVNFALFRPVYARPLKLGRSGVPVIETSNGALAVASEQANARYLALGFDPLPFLGRQNLPMSIFTLNSLDWLSAAASRAMTTGAALGERLRAAETLLTSAGETIDPRSNPAALYQGIYRIEGAAAQYIAVNFDNVAESDLLTPAPIQLRDDVGAAAKGSVAALLWRYVLAFALVLLLLEWFLHPLPTWRRNQEAP
jgi:hypothetical protein